MKEGKELYKPAELPAGMDVEPCPVCGADAELWQHSNDFKNGPIDKLIMCSNGDRFGPQDGAMNEGCLLYMPPQDFYRGRIAEAVKFWNQYARALNAQRIERNWKRAKVLRDAHEVAANPNSNFERASAIANKWPEWKRSYELTKDSVRGIPTDDTVKDAMAMNHDFSVSVTEPAGEDPCATTRLAIVRAAAAIWEQRENDDAEDE